MIIGARAATHLVKNKPDLLVAFQRRGCGPESERATRVQNLKKQVPIQQRPLDRSDRRYEAYDVAEMLRSFFDQKDQSCPIDKRDSIVGADTFRLSDDDLIAALAYAHANPASAQDAKSAAIRACVDARRFWTPAQVAESVCIEKAAAEERATASSNAAQIERQQRIANQRDYAAGRASEIARTRIT